MAPHPNVRYATKTEVRVTRDEPPRAVSLKVLANLSEELPEELGNPVITPDVNRIVGVFSLVWGHDAVLRDTLAERADRIAYTSIPDAAGSPENGSSEAYERL